ncbi:MAG: hypothetical protein KAX78_08605 [Phycisphaerae bacterium]|nr:hypothetical protein [Phycisphaerae bacterium]
MRRPTGQDAPARPGRGDYEDVYEGIDYGSDSGVFGRPIDRRGAEGTGPDTKAPRDTPGCDKTCRFATAGVCDG